MSPVRRDLEEARKQLAVVRASADRVIRIMTAEQALKAQRVVREAGTR